MSSKRETTLRQLVYMCNKHILKNEGMTRSELHEITDWVLNNAAVLDFKPDCISVTEGSYLGVGEENKDRAITIPRFLVYSWGKIRAFDFINNRDKRNFSLQSCGNFQGLEDFLRFNTSDDVVAVIDGEIVDFERVRNNNYYTEIIWDKDVFIVTYVLDDIEEKEVLRSKRQLEIRILELLEQGAEEVQAYDIVEGESLPFEVSKTVYTTKTKKSKEDEELGMMWIREIDGDFEEDDDWNPRGCYF